MKVKYGIIVTLTHLSIAAKRIFAFSSVPQVVTKSWKNLGDTYSFGVGTLAESKNRSFKISAIVNDDEDMDIKIDLLTKRRTIVTYGALSLLGCATTMITSTVGAYSGPQIDVNNAVAREFTAFPGLYPTIATKIVNGAKYNPYKTKADVYAVLESDLERDRLKQYDGAILISAPDAAIKQFKTSQICKYECGSRVSNSYRDEQIRQVQAARQGN